MNFITLTSDIGHRDYLIGAAKGLIHQMCPTSQVVDISHEVPSFNLPQAAYLLRSALPYFAEGSCHFLLVDLFSRTSNPAILCSDHGHFFLGPDNGLITMILGRQPERRLRLNQADGGSFTTMELINLFAHTVRDLHQGVAWEHLGTPLESCEELRSLQPMVHEDYIEAQIIFIDRFENVVINISREQFESSRKGRSFRIFVRIDEQITQISSSYSDVPEGNKVAFFNTAGFLEIAVNKGNAAGLFGLKDYRPGIADRLSTPHYYQTIRIHFDS